MSYRGNHAATIAATLLVSVAAAQDQNLTQKRANHALQVLRHEAYRHAEQIEGFEANFGKLLDEADRLIATDGIDPGPFLETFYWLNLGVARHLATAKATTEEEVRIQAQRLIELWSKHRARWPQLRLPLASVRQWGETAIYANDSDALARAVDVGRSAPQDDDEFERAMVHVLETKLHCHLGRLDKAAAAIAHAQAAADRHYATVRDDPEREPYGRQCLLAVALARTDLHLLGGDFDFAQESLAAAPSGEHKALYRDLIAVATGHTDREPALTKYARDRANPTRMRKLAFAKLAQAKLQRDESAAAAPIIAELATISPVASGELEGRSASLSLELALRHQSVGKPLLDQCRAAFGRLLERWRDAPRLPGGTGFLQLEDRSTLICNLLRAEALATGATETAVHRLAAAHAVAARLELSDGNPLAPLLSNERHGLLIYVPGRYASCLLCVDGKEQSLHELPAAPRLRASVAAMQRVIGRALSSEQWTAADRAAIANAREDLTDALLPDTVRERVCGYSRITISGAGMLLNAPFELLRLPEQKRALGCTAAIDYVANVVTARQVPTSRVAHEHPLLAASLLYSRNGTGHAAPSTINDCVATYAEVEGHRALEFTVDDAVRTADVVAALTNASVAHLIGHGVHDASRDHEHGIAFSKAEKLWADDLRGTDLSGLIAVLGACRAGTAPWRRGDDPLAASLAGAMLRAGARCVIVPTTDVRLGHHLRLAGELHAALARGTAPAEALRRARASFAAGSPGELEALTMQVHGRGF
ncbi:MAG: CHAT domain-containing protein [bacterium]|nr:CHAT domain-containing protein [bacterium]